jgi:hypothetical protein
MDTTGKLTIDDFRLLIFLNEELNAFSAQLSCKADYSSLGRAECQ